jgi:hypothetical protein
MVVFSRFLRACFRRNLNRVSGLYTFRSVNSIRIVWALVPPLDTRHSRGLDSDQLTERMPHQAVPLYVRVKVRHNVEGLQRVQIVGEVFKY